MKPVWLIEPAGPGMVIVSKFWPGSHDNMACKCSDVPEAIARAKEMLLDYHERHPPKPADTGHPSPGPDPACT